MCVDIQTIIEVFTYTYKTLIAYPIAASYHCLETLTHFCWAMKGGEQF